MEDLKPPDECYCSCGLNFGVDQLSAQDILNSHEVERKYKLVNQTIHFHGGKENPEICLIKEQIDQIKDRVKEFYFEKESKLIVIPNQIPLPNQSLIIHPEETDKKKQKKGDDFKNDYLEYMLHQEVINAVRRNKNHAFVYQGFNSGDCLRLKSEKGNLLRKENECKCKASIECKCGKLKYPELNAHELDIMKILDVRDIEYEELAQCIEMLKKYKSKKVKKSEDKKKETMESILPENQTQDKDDADNIEDQRKDEKSWLFNKV